MEFARTFWRHTTRGARHIHIVAVVFVLVYDYIKYFGEDLIYDVL